MTTKTMKKQLLAAALCAACVTSASAKTLTVGIDLSGSNPLLRHENFAFMASQYLAQEISGLSNGDVVAIKTFGARGEVSNLLSGSYTVSRRMKPQKIASQVATYVNALSELTQTGQASTNLLAWMEFTSGFQCDLGSSVIVVTDAVESSSVVDGVKFVEGKQGLPEPDVDLTGCDVTFWGVGAGLPYSGVKTVRKEWRRWVESSGAAFNAIVP